MKKLATFLAIGLASVVGQVVCAEDVKRTDADVATWQNKASSQVALGISSGGITYSEEGLVGIRETFQYLAAPSTFSIAEVIFSSADTLTLAPTNFSLAPTNTWVRVRAQPTSPSPIWVQFWFNSTFSTNTFSAPVTISGIDSLGSSRTITVITSTGSNNPSRVFTTGAAFAFISTVSVGLNTSTTTALHGAPLHLVLGTTNQIGLANDLVSDGDVYAVWENGIAQSSITASGNNNTFSPNSIPTGVSTTTVNGGVTIPLGTKWDVLYRARQSPPLRVLPNTMPRQ